MDRQTLAAYNQSAAAYCLAHRAVVPTRLYDLVRGFFTPGANTGDIGCGSGRDTAWLHEQGFSVVGYDASQAMLSEAQAHYPRAQFAYAALPDLGGVPDAAFDNVLCSAVLMHIPRSDLITAVLSLARVLRPGGRLIVSLRPSSTAGEREADGRLFTDVPKGKLTLLLESAGLAVASTMMSTDSQRPEVGWTTILAERRSIDAARGLDRLQGILAQDRKFATYKLALVRSLCDISRTQEHAVAWHEDRVWVPMSAVAARWLEYYWPFATSRRFVAQRRGESHGGPKPIAVREPICRLAARLDGAGGYGAMLASLDKEPNAFDAELRIVANTIRDGPVTHAGSIHDPVFTYERCNAAPPGCAREAGRFGWVTMPQAIWLDICRFDHWICDSVLVRWARLTTDMNPQMAAGDALQLLLATEDVARDTTEARRMLAAAGGPLRCVWTDRPLAHDIHIDHLIPYAVWGNNDLWNLLPAVPSVNGAKSDSIPSLALLGRRRAAIVEYWRTYRTEAPAKFGNQIHRALGGDTCRSDWEVTAFSSLRETVQRLTMSRGLCVWEP